LQETALDIFWGDGADSLNFLAELTIQKRIEDPWYASLLTECRNGDLSHESYCFLCGLPTLHSGSWYRDQDGADQWLCESSPCRSLSEEWRRRSQKGESWPTLQQMECETCKKHRNDRNRLIEQCDRRVNEPPFLQAPYVHKNNDPKYHALLLRSVEYAKRHPEGARQILWFCAEDTLLNPDELSISEDQLKVKLSRFLQYNDQKTAGIPGLFPLYAGMRVRITEKIAKTYRITLLKHSPCTVVGWILDPRDREKTADPQRRLDYLPTCIFIHFANAKWQVLSQLPCGVFPLFLLSANGNLTAPASPK
jgi:hypothetical protein